MYIHTYTQLAKEHYDGYQQCLLPSETINSYYLPSSVLSTQLEFDPCSNAPNVDIHVLRSSVDSNASLASSLTEAAAEMR